MKKIYKEISILFMCFLMLVSFCGCSSQKVQNNNAEVEAQYYEYAQQCIEEGNVEEAIKALEEGIAATGSEKLQQLLDEINSDENIQSENITETQPDVDENIPKVKSLLNVDQVLEKWGSFWATEGSGDDGSFVLICTYHNEEEVSIRIESTSSAPQYRVAMIEAVVNISNMQGDKILIEYNEDGWGNSGKCLLTHNGDSIVCKIYDVIPHTETPGGWSLNEGEYRLIKSIYS